VAVEVKITSLPNGNGVKSKGPRKPQPKLFFVRQDECRGRKLRWKCWRAEACVSFEGHGDSGK